MPIFCLPLVFEHFKNQRVYYQYSLISGTTLITRSGLCRYSLAPLQAECQVLGEDRCCQMVISHAFIRSWLINTGVSGLALIGPDWNEIRRNWRSQDQFQYILSPTKKVQFLSIWCQSDPLQGPTLASLDKVSLIRTCDQLLLNSTI